MTPTPAPTPITVTIITPCYNGAPYLRDTIESALAQTRPPLEVIVIDDGSTDDSAAIAESFGEPVRVLRQANQGESVARNRGIAEARGTHLLFLDADDLIAPEALERLTAAVATRPDSIALMGCARFTTDPRSPDSVVDAATGVFFPTLIQTNLGPPHTWLAPTRIVRQAGGFYEPLQWSEDWDVLWRIGLHAAGIECVPYAGALYRQHPKSQFATMGLANRRRGHAAVMARMIPAFLERPDLLERHGSALFWGGWTAHRRARVQGVSWTELRALRRGLNDLATRGPKAVTETRTATVARLLGVRLTMWLEAALPRTSDD